MKLYFATGACSPAPNIAAREAGIPLEPEWVDIPKHPGIAVKLAGAA